eukprot:scaffold3852_cov106-Skeletonema_marinoi.AAC.2
MLLAVVDNEIMQPHACINHVDVVFKAELERSPQNAPTQVNFTEGALHTNARGRTGLTSTDSLGVFLSFVFFRRLQAI